MLKYPVFRLLAKIFRFGAFKDQNIDQLGHNRSVFDEKKYEVKNYVILNIL